jgi:hypothetical protein
MSPLFNRRFRRICMIAGMVLLLPAGSLAQSPNNSAQMPDKSPQSTLELALYYYNNDDLNDRAEHLFKQLLTKRYHGTPQSETAQYYLAAYYQRRFYLCRDKRGDPDWSALKQAAVEYRNHTDKYYGEGSHQWLNDSFFNLAMVHLQLGEPWNALNELSKMKNAAEIDSGVYIYQIIWSSQSQDVIDSSFPASQLADYATKVIQENGKNFDRAVLLIQKWCQGKRAKTYQATAN